VWSKYKGDYSRILDVAAASVVLPSTVAVKRALDYLHCVSAQGTSGGCGLDLSSSGSGSGGVSLHSAEVVRAKNRFRHPSISGYRDYLINLRLTIGQSVASAPGAAAFPEHVFSTVVELQLHIEPLYAVQARPPPLLPVGRGGGLGWDAEIREAETELKEAEEEEATAVMLAAKEAQEQKKREELRLQQEEEGQAEGDVGSSQENEQPEVQQELSAVSGWALIEMHEHATAAASTASTALLWPVSEYHHSPWQPIASTPFGSVLSVFEYEYGPTFHKWVATLGALDLAGRRAVTGCYAGARDVRGRRDGTGTFYFADGGRYTGEFWHGTIGAGVYHYPDGSWYEGQFVGSQRHGYGVYHAGLRAAAGVSSGIGGVFASNWYNDQPVAVPGSMGTRAAPAEEHSDYEHNLGHFGREGISYEREERGCEGEERGYYDDERCSQPRSGGFKGGWAEQQDAIAAVAPADELAAMWEAVDQHQDTVRRTDVVEEARRHRREEWEEQQAIEGQEEDDEDDDHEGGRDQHVEMAGDVEGEVTDEVTQEVRELRERIRVLEGMQPRQQQTHDWEQQHGQQQQNELEWKQRQLRKERHQHRYRQHQQQDLKMYSEPSGLYAGNFHGTGDYGGGGRGGSSGSGGRGRSSGGGGVRRSTTAAMAASRRAITAQPSHRQRGSGKVEKTDGKPSFFYPTASADSQSLKQKEAAAEAAAESEVARVVKERTHGRSRELGIHPHQHRQPVSASAAASSHGRPSTAGSGRPRRGCGGHVVGWESGNEGYMATDAEASETERQRKKRWIQQTRHEKERAQNHQQRQLRLRQEDRQRRAAAEVNGLDDWEGAHSQPNGSPHVDPRHTLEEGPSRAV
jgi:hypothetical protein